MKKRNWDTFLILMILLFIGLISLGGPVRAHSPTRMNISYNVPNSILTVNITHPVEDNTTHYISGVKICLRESVFKEYNYTNQPTNDTFQYYFSIETEKGDKIKVAAYCNVDGEIHDDLIIGAVNSNLDIPGFNKIGIIFIFSVALLVGITLYKIKKFK